jgi:Fe2+ or Zn2+ uptake regulation protein
MIIKSVATEELGSAAGTDLRRPSPGGGTLSAVRDSQAKTALHTAVASALSRHGVRYTSHRRRLVTALSEAGQPLTIPQLVEAAATVPQSSVYRNLAIFDEAGIVHRMAGSDDFGRYELAEELMGHHHHLVCSNCGAVEDVVLPTGVEAELERSLTRVARQRGYTLSSHRLDLVGDCGSCASG